MNRSSDDRPGGDNRHCSSVYRDRWQLILSDHFPAGFIKIKTGITRAWNILSRRLERYCQTAGESFGYFGYLPNTGLVLARIHRLFRLPLLCFVLPGLLYGRHRFFISPRVSCRAPDKACFFLCVVRVFVQRSITASLAVFWWLHPEFPVFWIDSQRWSIQHGLEFNTDYHSPSLHGHLSLLEVPCLWIIMTNWTGNIFI